MEEDGMFMTETAKRGRLTEWGEVPSLRALLSWWGRLCFLFRKILPFL
jgi:hypothetical protein